MCNIDKVVAATARQGEPKQPFFQQADLKWGISRGQDTYGYNICSLSTPNGRFKTVGGGYDMVGTVFGAWLETILTQEELKDAHDAKIYGVYKYRDDQPYSLSGPSGLSCMIAVAEHAGYKVTRLYNYDRQGRVKATIGFIIERA